VYQVHVGDEGPYVFEAIASKINEEGHIGINVPGYHGLDEWGSPDKVLEYWHLTPIDAIQYRIDRNCINIRYLENANKELRSLCVSIVQSEGEQGL